MRLASTRIHFIAACIPAAAFAQDADTGVKALRQTCRALAAIARTVSPAVVFIRVESKVADGVQMLRFPLAERSPVSESSPKYLNEHAGK